MCLNWGHGQANTEGTRVLSSSNRPKNVVTWLINSNTVATVIHFCLPKSCIKCWEIGVFTESLQLYTNWWEWVQVGETMYLPLNIGDPKMYMPKQVNYTKYNLLTLCIWHNDSAWLNIRNMKNKHNYILVSVI